MRTAVVDVGGGLRGVYATGVLDRCLEEGVRFDAGVGVSAGSANIASYLAGQKGRNYQVYAEYSSRKEYTWAWHSAMGKRGVRIRCCLYTCSPSISDSRSKFCT